MRVPRQLQPLVRDGLIDEVVRPLMTGKEATVYLVIAHGEECCAKAYKDATQRSFKNRADYQEGRRTKNSRRARAMQRGSKFGKREQEDDWQNAEVDALYKLAAAGVRVPKPMGFSEGVLVMELIVGTDGDIAPRLNDVGLEPDVARDYFQRLLVDVVKMLCAGLIHGDLSEYNVLVGTDGPVIIDLPQAIDAAANNSASKMLRRDVDNLGAYFGQFAPELAKLDYGREIWQLYEKGELYPDTELTGRYEHPTKEVDVGGVLQDIDDAREEATREGPIRSTRKRGGKGGPAKVKGQEIWRGVVPDMESSVGVNDSDIAAVVTSPTGNRRVVDLKAPPKPEKPPEPEKPKKRRRRRGRKPADEGGETSDGQSQSSGGRSSDGQSSGGQSSGGQSSGGQRSGGQRSGGQSSGGQRSGGQRSGGQRSGGQSQQSGGQSRSGDGVRSDTTEGRPSRRRRRGNRSEGSSGAQSNAPRRDDQGERKQSSSSTNSGSRGGNEAAKTATPNVAPSSPKRKRQRLRIKRD